MAYRSVRARPDPDRLGELRDRVESAEIAEMDPFGRAMTESLRRARRDPETGEAVRVEEDYCTPPLATEREAVFEEYFAGITVVDEDVDEAEGWAGIEDLPSLWDRIEA